MGDSFSLMTAEAAMLLVVFSVACGGKSRTETDDARGNGGAAAVGASGGTGGTAGTSTGGTGTVGTGGTGTVGTGGTGGTVNCPLYCERLSECQSISPEGCASICRWSDDENTALGCIPQYQVMIACSLANGLCGFGAGTCEMETTAYALCASTSGSTMCKTACMRQAECDGVFSPECFVMCGRDARLAAEIGCSGEHDAYLECALSHPDPCDITSEGCGPEDEAFLQCALR